MSLKKMALLCLIFPFLLQTSCRTVGGSSHTKHDLGRVKNDSNPWQWQELSFKEVQTYLYPEEKENLLPLNHPLTLGFQKIVDRLDQHIRSLDPEGTKDIPRAKALIRKTPVDNAVSETVNVCLPFSLRFEGGGTGLIDRAVFTRNIPDINGYGAADKKPACKYLALNSNQMTSLMQWIMSVYPGCGYRIGDREVILQDSCRSWLFPGFRTIAGAKEISFYQVSNWVTIYTGMLPNSNEEETASVLAHELAHFHFAHIASRPELYNIYYRLGSRAPDHKPIADPALEVLGKQLSKASNLLVAELYPAVGDRAEAGLMFGTWSRLLPAITQKFCQQRGSCPVACQDLQNQVFAKDRLPIFGDFPLGELPDDARDAWQTFDRLANSCAAGFSVADSPILKADILQAIGEFSELMQTRIKDLPANMNVKAWLSWLEAQHQTLYATLLKDYQQQAAEAEADQLGQYTIEQEADEAGLEWSVAMGISPALYLQQRVKWLQNSNDKSSTNPHPITTKRCLRYLQQDWKGDRGEPIIVTPGDYAEAHQQACYRVFSISREIKTHQYITQGRWETVLPNWSQLVQSLVP